MLYCATDCTSARRETALWQTCCFPTFAHGHLLLCPHRSRFISLRTMHRAQLGALGRGRCLFRNDRLFFLAIMPRIGYFATPKKRGLLEAFATYCGQHGVSCVEVDPAGPDTAVDILFQKIVDYIPDPSAAHVIQKLEAYIARHPSMKVIDPIYACSQTVSRTEFSTRLERSGVRCPSWVLCYGHEGKSFHFPAILKTDASCGADTSHEMYYCATADGVEAALQHLPFPIFVQKFIKPKDDRVWKVYVLGNSHWTFSRQVSWAALTNLLTQRQ
eukprot:TRINITY_DN6393_c0_g1_i4.p1 TRINITY_DN6393_c0_g1~~TRINITY_DN6393_c0_g1_i4.p1  ORF type:complete len:273 (-),score=13.72 TRINITY_DN6393_c0_g1_i4:267-1085(-)